MSGAPKSVFCLEVSERPRMSDYGVSDYVTVNELVMVWVKVP